MSDVIQFREIKLEGGWLMVKPERQELWKAMALVRRHKQRLYDLEIKEHREKRSLDANAYAWVLIHKLAEAMRITPEEVYLQAILGIGGNCTPVCLREKDVDAFLSELDSCGMLISAVHKEDGEEKLNLLMLDDAIPAGAKMY